MAQLFELSDAQYERVLATSKPVPYLIANGTAPRGQQENANAAWQAVAAELGFVWDTARPAIGRGDRFIMAEPATLAKDS